MTTVTRIRSSAGAGPGSGEARRAVRLGFVSWLIALASSPAGAAEMTVPSGPYPTLEIAVATAKINGDPNG